MTVRPILLHPNPALRARCAPVGAVTEEVRRLAADLLDTMYAAPGRGLAAPQVGVLLRVFVVDASWKEGRPEPEVFVNPEVVAVSADAEAAEERCLSIPDRPALVTRPVAATLSWTDLDGMRREGRLTGARARCALHELDHLDGVLILDRAEGAAPAPAL